MAKTIGYVSGVVFFVGGVIAGILSAQKVSEGTKERGNDSTNDPVPGSIGTNEKEWMRSIADIEKRLAAQESSTALRFQRMEARLEEHAAKLADMPSTVQIVSAMEQLLAKTMGSLTDRLTTQAHSIEVLKTTVSQTDGLLEKVLESLDSLQADSSEGTDEGLFNRAV